MYWQGQYMRQCRYNSLKALKSGEIGRITYLHLPAMRFYDEKCVCTRCTFEGIIIYNRRDDENKIKYADDFDPVWHACKLWTVHVRMHFDWTIWSGDKYWHSKEKWHLWHSSAKKEVAIPSMPAWRMLGRHNYNVVFMCSSKLDFSIIHIQN